MPSPPHTSVSPVLPPLSSRRVRRRTYIRIAVAAVALLGLTGVVAGGGWLRENIRSVYRRVRNRQRERVYAGQFSPLTASAPERTSPAEITIPVSVETDQDLHLISPLIYGMAFAPPDYVRDLRLGLNRWGGNDKTRYNWAEGNACSAARDWRFANRSAVAVPGLKEGPSSTAAGYPCLWRPSR